MEFHRSPPYKIPSPQATQDKKSHSHGVVFVFFLSYMILIQPLNKWALEGPCKSQNFMHNCVDMGFFSDEIIHCIYLFLIYK